MPRAPRKPLPPELCYLLVRCPKELHRSLKVLAAERGETLENMVNRFLGDAAFRAEGDRLKQLLKGRQKPT